MDERDMTGKFEPEDLEAFPGAEDAPADAPAPEAPPADVNPWNGPIDPSYGAFEPAFGSTQPRYRMGGGAIALIAVAVVVIAVAIAFAGPHLLGPAEPEPAPDEVFSEVDPLDHGSPEGAPDEDLPEELRGDGNAWGGALDADALTGDERAAYDAADARLTALTTADPVEMDLIGALVSEGFAHQMEYFTLSDCGVDATEYARVMTEELAYTIDDVYVGQEGDSALVRATVTCRDVFSAIDGFNAMMEAYKGSDEFAVSTYEQDIERVGIMFMEAARTAPMNDGYRMDIVLHAEGDGWAIDEDTWELKLDYLFDVE